jgi:ADP-ribose pyrophosphatase YjhB (NUDIX family)
MPAVRVVARGVLLSGGRILLARNLRKPHCFLPGGRVETGEAARAALEREFREETGLKVRAGRFLGAVEHVWKKKGELRQELNLIFLVQAHMAKPGARVVSREEHLRFVWRPLSRLDAARLEPWPLRNWLAAALRRNASPRFDSSFSGEA